MEKQKTYGFLNNFIYALNIERKSNLRLLAITLIKPIGDIVGTLLNSYAPKYVLSFIEDDLPFNTIIMYTVIICLIMMILDVISTTCYNSFEFEYRKTEGYVEKKRMDKLFHTDFKNMESPDFLDYAQRAKTALNRGKGFHGVLYQSRNCPGNINDFVSGINRDPKSINDDNFHCNIFWNSKDFIFLYKKR